MASRKSVLASTTYKTTSKPSLSKWTINSQMDLAFTRCRQCLSFATYKRQSKWRRRSQSSWFRT